MTIETHKLENGMTIVLEENHAAKVISLSALVKVGSSQELENEAGISHVIEHMLFKGTPTRPTGSIARDVEAAGGEINAYTSIDQTVYYINMASRFADRGLEILTDAIQNPLFDAQELEREKEVILEEIRREKDNPSRMAIEQIFNTAYTAHTYRRPIIGYPETVKSFSHEMLLNFHRRWYCPKNITFIVVGDFNSSDMLSAIRERFKNHTGGEVPCMDIPVEPEQLAMKSAVKGMNVQSAYISLGFHVPAITDADVPAIDLLSHILGGSDSSRLEQEIKEKKRLVHQIYCSAFTPRYPGLFSIGAVAAEENASKAIDAIWDELESVKARPVKSDELSRAKLFIRSNEIYDRETVGGQAAKIASFIATAGSYEFEKRYFQMISSVVTEDILRVAQRYLTRENCTISLVVPDSSKLLKKGSTIRMGGALIKSKGKKPSKPSDGKVRPIKLSNGIRMVIVENHSLPLVTICAAALGGSRFETKKNCGISMLTARSLTKGTKKRSAIEISSEIERYAGSIDGFSGRNSIGVRCEFLSEHLRSGFELFADILTNPSFDKTEVKNERTLQLKAIKDQEDALSSMAFAKFLEKIFPKHPYGFRSMGTLEAVKQLSERDLAAYYRKIVTTSNLVVGVVGDINAEEIVELAEEYLQALHSGKSATKKIPLDPRPKAIQKVELIKRDKEQAHIVIGFQGTKLASPDRFAMTVLNNILAGQGGRLFLELRDKLSLAYSVSSVNSEGIDPGFFAVYIGTEPAKIDLACSAMLSELKKISTDEVSDAELDRSKQYLVGSYELDFQRFGSIAGMRTFNELYGLGQDELDEYPQRILEVKKEDVLRVAKKYITLGSYAISIIKPK